MINKAKQLSMQIGKAGVTDNFIMTLQNAFKTHYTIRLSALQSSGRDKESIVKMADNILSKLKGNYAYRILGFTIIFKRQSNTSIRNQAAKAKQVSQ
jgi:RNA-binding protein YhbY